MVPRLHQHAGQIKKLLVQEQDYGIDKHQVLTQRVLLIVEQVWQDLIALITHPEQLNSVTPEISAPANHIVEFWMYRDNGYSSDLDR
jgi:hypothetical protein